jgi:hydroxyacylglutathione hydrolase
MQLTEKLYWYPWQGRANNCNSIIYKGSKLVLFDPGHIYNDFNESCLETLRRQAEADGLFLKDIELILCTHGHPDHVEAAGLVRKESGATFGINRGDEFILEAITQHYASRSGRELPDLKPDFYLEEGELSLDPKDPSGEKIRVITSPGHSPGCVCFYLPGEKALISGDTIFQNSIGRTDLPGGDMEIMGKSVEKLASLKGIELLLPGHMDYISGAAAVDNNFTQIKRFFFS